MPVERERIPDGLLEDFRALNGDEIVGRVYQIPHGPQSGLWFWTMTVVRPGPRVGFPTNVGPALSLGSTIMRLWCPRESVHRCAPA
jgi:hypothetical protein